MAKYLVQVSYSGDGLVGLMKDKAAGRVAAVRKAVVSLGGKLDAFYWTLGEDDAITIVDMPDVEAVAALAISVSSSGLATTKTTRLLTADEIDTALSRSIRYRAPGM
jgi:uncharacterized protein with GYD domain